MRFIRQIALAALFASAYPVSAASFDCAKADSRIEHLLCDEAALGALDERMADRYAALIDTSPRDDVVGIRAAQRAWLHRRDACAAQDDMPACLRQALDGRFGEIDDGIATAARRLDAIIAGIPTAPAPAAAALRRYAGPLPSAWLVYLQRFVPDAGVSIKESRARSASVTAALRRQDSFAASVLADVTADPAARKSGAAELTLLRMAIEHAGYDDRRAYVHCFIFERQGALAYDAMGALYGSTRDSFAPVCAPRGDLFDRAAWQQLEAAFAPLIANASRDSGTIRFASFASWRVLDLRATVSPLDFISAAYRSGHPVDDPDAALRRWSDDAAWPAADRRTALAALPLARRATAQWLVREREMARVQADDTAAAIVAAWVGERLAYADEWLPDGAER